MIELKFYAHGLAVVLVIVMLAVPPVHADEVSRATMLSLSCTGCHGTDGKSPGSIPTIGGKSSDFIATALREFRSGKRAGTVMSRHASGYSDEETQLIANYFASR